MPNQRKRFENDWGFVLLGRIFEHPIDGRSSDESVGFRSRKKCVRIVTFSKWDEMTLGTNCRLGRIAAWDELSLYV